MNYILCAIEKKEKGNITMLNAEGASCHMLTINSHHIHIITKTKELFFTVCHHVGFL